jgi:glucose/arabinose dehydrogenase
MAVAPDGRVFVCEQSGALRVINANGQLVSTPFATVPARDQDEQGLLGVALAPDFATSGTLYVHYTGEDARSRIHRFAASASNSNVAAGAGTEILVLPEDPSFGYNHQGGALGFGVDGKLYFTVGEHNHSEYAQDVDSPFGKILRLNPDGTFPANNPFYTSPSAWRSAVWTLGLRNPFSFAFQPGTGRLFVNDVGGGLREEVNEVTAGANYGWPLTEGKFDAAQHPTFTNPLHDYERGIVGDAITGSSFYNPAANVTRPWPASYHGKYLYTDYGSTYLKTLGPADNFSASTTFTNDLPPRPIDVEVAPLTGDVLVLTRGSEGNGNGALMRIAYTASDAPSIGTQPQNKTVAVGQPATFTVAASGTPTLSYQWQRDGVDIGGATGTSYTLASPQLSDSGARFRCVVTNGFGTATSDAATLTVTANQPPTATITAPTSGATYHAGDTISFSGTGADGEEGALPASAFTWRVDFHHASHTHPALPPTDDVTAGSYETPNNIETAADVWYRVHLTVTDSGGLSHSTYRDVTPITANVTLATNVAGLALSLDGAPFTAPVTFTGVAGVQRSIGAPQAQTVGGVTYEFASWSDGGNATHTIATPDVGTTYTATYRAVPKVQAVAVNDSHAQRSKVTGLTVVFNKAVVLDPGAFVLNARNDAGAGTNVATSNPSSDGITWLLSFTGSLVVGGSLADGIYDLTVVASKVHAVDAQGMAMTADHTFEFHRLFSDANGDGDSDNGDLVAMRHTYGKAAEDPGYLWYWDYTADGDVDNGDLIQVRSRRGIFFTNY